MLFGEKCIPMFFLQSVPPRMRHYQWILTHHEWFSSRFWVTWSWGKCSLTQYAHIIHNFEKNQSHLKNNNQICVALCLQMRLLIHGRTTSLKILNRGNYELLKKIYIFSFQKQHMFVTPLIVEISIRKIFE